MNKAVRFCHDTDLSNVLSVKQNSKNLDKMVVGPPGARLSYIRTHLPLYNVVRTE